MSQAMLLLRTAEAILGLHRQRRPALSRPIPLRQERSLPDGGLESEAEGKGGGDEPAGSIDNGLLIQACSKLREALAMRAEVHGQGRHLMEEEASSSGGHLSG